MKIKKTYSFAFWTSIAITLFTHLTLSVFSYFYLNEAINIKFIFLTGVVLFAFSFFLIQYYLVKFIYKQIDLWFFHNSLIRKNVFLTNERQEIALNK